MENLENFEYVTDLKLNPNSNARYALSTTDNPYSPFDNWNEWLQYDLERARVTRGLDCSAMLARFAHTSYEMSENMYNAEIERAIDEIIKYDPMNEYVKCINDHYEQIE